MAKNSAFGINCMDRGWGKGRSLKISLLLTLWALRRACLSQWCSQKRSKWQSSAFRQHRWDGHLHPIIWCLFFTWERLFQVQDARGSLENDHSLLQGSSAISICHHLLFNSLRAWTLKRMHSWWSKCGLQILSFQVATLTSQGAFVQHLEPFLSMTDALLGFWRCTEAWQCHFYDASIVLFGALFWRLCPWNTPETWGFPPVQESKPVRFLLNRRKVWLLTLLKRWNDTPKR